MACVCAFGFAFTIFQPPHSSGQAPPPVTSADAQDYKAAEDLFNASKFKEATELFEKFLEKYKMLSPKSLDAKFRLAFCYLRQELYDDAMRLLKELIADKKVEVAAKEMAQSLMGKALTLKGFKMPADTDPQKAQQKRIFADAIKEYDTFVATYPKSRDIDGVLFLRATLLLQSDNYDEALKGFVTVARYQQSPFAWEAYMWSSKTMFIQANSLLEIKAGKDPKPEDIKKALALFDAAQPGFEQVYQKSGDTALNGPSSG